MDITYLGHASFLLKGKNARVVVDPYSESSMGMKFPKVEADIVTLSHHHDDHNAVEQVGGEPLVIDIPGEYEKVGIRMYGFETYHDKVKGAERGKNTMFKFEIDGVTILHCGDLGHALSSEMIQEINGADVVLVPVGGFYTINADEARQVVEKLEPSIAIPMHYRLDNSPALMKDVAPLSEFLEKVGVTDAEPTKKLTVKKSDLGEEEMKIVVMEARS